MLEMVSVRVPVLVSVTIFALLVVLIIWFGNETLVVERLTFCASADIEPTMRHNVITRLILTSLLSRTMISESLGCSRGQLRTDFMDLFLAQGPLQAQREKTEDRFLREA